MKPLRSRDMAQNPSMAINKISYFVSWRRKTEASVWAESTVYSLVLFIWYSMGLSYESYLRLGSIKLCKVCNSHLTNIGTWWGRVRYTASFQGRGRFSYWNGRQSLGRIVQDQSLNRRTSNLHLFVSPLVLVWHLHYGSHLFVSSLCITVMSISMGHSCLYLPLY